MGERICPEEAPCCGISTGSLLSVMIHSLLLLEPECGKGDKELMLSDNMQNSIERWKRAYGQVTEKEIKKLEMEKALKKLLEDFFYVWNFRVLDTAFVREFLKHKNDDRYKRAMIVLIELMDKETKYFPELTKREANIWLIREIRDADEMIEINAYLGMLRNHLRRKEILGF